MGGDVDGRAAIGSPQDRGKVEDDQCCDDQDQSDQCFEPPFRRISVTDVDLMNGYSQTLARRE